MTHHPQQPMGPRCYIFYRMGDTAT